MTVEEVHAEQHCWRDRKAEKKWNKSDKRIGEKRYFIRPSTRILLAQIARRSNRQQTQCRVAVHDSRKKKKEAEKVGGTKRNLASLMFRTVAFLSQPQLSCISLSRE